jgi:hypothetical protein
MKATRITFVMALAVGLMVSCGDIFSAYTVRSVTYHGNGSSLGIPSSVTTIGKQAFSDTDLASVTINAGCLSIDAGAFSDCKSLTSIALPDTLITIAGDIYWGGAFSGCSALASITLPSKLATIGNSAFSSCTSLATIDIPASVTSLGASAFSGCTSLVTVKFLGSTPPTVGSGGFLGTTVPAAFAIKVPTAALAKYQSAWTSYAAYISGY